MNKFNCFITFDLDYVNYTSDTSNSRVNEFKIVEDKLLPYLEKENIKATWFIRIDKKIENDFGEPDFLFKKHSETIEKLKSLGHKIGWHPHNYVLKDGKWIQNSDEQEVLEELNYLLPIVKKYNLDIVRVGWGYQTNKTMKFFNDNGFKIDSSCMARPRYSFDMSIKDWEISTNKIYYPSKNDYRVQTNDNLSILEVPMTTIDMSVSTDTEKVKRYINLAFYNKIMKEPLANWIENNNYLITITHPYEIYKNEKNHHIISFDFNEFIKNIEFIKNEVLKKERQVEFITLDEFLND